MGRKKPVVLTIDDEFYIRASIRDYLEDNGYELLEAKDGHEGIALFLRERPNLVLVDLRMPGMDGLEVLERISRESPDTPIIVISGTGVISDVIEALRLGAWDYLLKPIEDMNILLHSVRKALERAALLAQSRRYNERLEAEVQRRTEELSREVRVRKQAEAELLYFSRAVEESPLSIIITTVDGVIETVNPHFCRLTGYSAKEAVGSHISILRSHLSDESDYDILWERIRKGKVWQGVLRSVKKSGEPFWESVSVAPVRRADGSFDRVLIIREDITDRQRTAMELARARDAAEEASRSKSEFLANMSHEMRTPLNGMLGMIQLLAMSDLDGEQREMLSTAMQSGRNLLRVLSDVLDFSKMEAGVFSMSSEPFAPAETVRFILDNFTVQAAERSIVLKHRIHPEVPGRVIGDEARIRQILFNLVGNALKFTEQGEVSLECYPLPDPRDPERLRLFFSVADTGIGIPDDKVGAVFDAFTQVDGSYSRRYQGTGLGLGIVRRLVSLMDGGLSVETELGRGTTVLFYVRVGTVEEVRSFPGADEGDAIPATSPRRILLVEDDAISRLLAQRILQKHGHDVVGAENGIQALDILKENLFDCVLMDIQMPGMDGMEATRIIRKDKRFAPHAHIPIIATTAHAMSGDRERFLASGMTDYISKPLEIGELNRVLGRIFEDAAAES